MCVFVFFCGFQGAADACGIGLPHPTLLILLNPRWHPKIHPWRCTGQPWNRSPLSNPGLWRRWISPTTPWQRLCKPLKMAPTASRAISGSRLIMYALPYAQQCTTNCCDICRVVLSPPGGNGNAQFTGESVRVCRLRWSVQMWMGGCQVPRPFLHD